MKILNNNKKTFLSNVFRARRKSACRTRKNLLDFVETENRILCSECAQLYTFVQSSRAESIDDRYSSYNVGFCCVF